MSEKKFEPEIRIEKRYALIIFEKVTVLITRDRLIANGLLIHIQEKKISERSKVPIVMVIPSGKALIRNYDRGKHYFDIYCIFQVFGEDSVTVSIPPGELFLPEDTEEFGKLKRQYNDMKINAGKVSVSLIGINKALILVNNTKKIELKIFNSNN